MNQSKIKIPQVLGGIAAIAYLFSNIFLVIDWLNRGSGWYLNLTFLAWPISVVVDLASILAFTIFYKNTLGRYLAVGAFLATRVILTLHYYFVGYSFRGLFFDLGIAITYLNNLAPIYYKAAVIFLFLSTLTFLAAVITSFVPTKKTGPEPRFIESNFVVPSAPRPKVAMAASKNDLSDIEILGGLLEKGLLTQEEFDRKKKEILDFS